MPYKTRSPKRKTKKTPADLCAERGRGRARKLFAVSGPCNRCESPATDRHHKDGDTWNNSAENIEFLCSQCHTRHHATRTDEVPCSECGKVTKPLRKGKCNACYEYIRRGKGRFRRKGLPRLYVAPRDSSCSIPGCDRVGRSGTGRVCEMHYYRMRRTGSYELKDTAPKVNLKELRAELQGK